MAETSPLATPGPWELVVDGYTDINVPHFERYAADALRLAGLRSGEHVLDVAAGPGTLALLAARTARVAALDFAPAMVERLRTRAAAAGVEVGARVGDGMALPYADGTFDVAFSMFGLMFFPDRARGFGELLRVLRPGGRAVVSAWAPMEREPLLAEFFAALRAELPGLPVGEGRAPLSAPEDFTAEMGAAGFSDVRVEEVVYAVEADSMAALFDGMCRSAAPMVLLRRRMDAAAWEALSAGLLGRMRARFGDGPQRMRMAALLGCGVRPG